MRNYSKILSILLVIIYSTSTFQALIPITLNFLKYAQIITSLCDQKDNPNYCNDACYPAKEIRKQNENNNKEKLIGSSLIKISHESSSSNNVVYINHFEMMEKIYINSKELKAFNKPLLPPPKFRSVS